ncbi:MAG: FAD-dependent oxidoreductase [bacterium]
MMKDKKRVIIIGGGVAGRNVARELSRREGENFEVYLIKRETHPSYSPCGMPYVLAGDVEKPENLLFPGFDKKLESRGVKLKFGKEVTLIDRTNNNVFFKEGDILGYDVLVLATGRKPFRLKIPGIELDGVFTLIDFNDGIKLYKAIEKTREAVIIGGGFIGLEVATGFIKRGIKTTIVELKPYVLHQLLDQDMAKIVEQRLEDLGVSIFTQKKVKAINGEKEVESVSIKEEEIKADLVLLAAGIMPNVDLAREAGIDIGTTGGIVVDDTLHVRANGRFLSNVYALGDCIEVRDKITGSLCLCPLIEPAVLQARVATESILGENPQGVLDSLSPSITFIGGLEIGSVGITGLEAQRIGIKPITKKVTGRTREGYYPECKEMVVKLFAIEDRLIGAQVISEEDTKGVINEITALINAKVKLKDILYQERCYTPSLSSSPDAFKRAVEKMVGG